MRRFRGAWTQLRSGMNDALAPYWLHGRLLRAEREAERIFEMSSGLLAVAGFDGYLRRFNPAFDVFGYSREELLSRPWIEFAHPNDRERMLQAAASLEHGADVVKLENRVICRDGSLRWVEWSTRVVPEEGLFYAAGRDVTESRHAVEEQAALRRVATLVAHGVAPDDVFRAVAAEVGVLFGSEVSVIARFEDDGAVTVLGAVGWPEIVGERVELVPGYVTYDVRETGRSARFDTDDPDDPDMPPLVRSLGVRSAVASPIIVESELWGSITAASLDDPLPPGAERRLTDFTELVATAFANTQAREEVAALADEQAALRRVATLVARESSPVEIFRAVTEEAARVLDTEAVGLLRFEPDATATLVAQSQTPWDPPPLGTRFTLDGDNLVARAFRTGHAARQDDWANASGSVAAMADALGVRSSVATPIVVEGRLWGTMVATTSRSEPLPADTESRVGQFTELVATAIANAEARGELSQLVEEQAALRRVATLVAEDSPSAQIFAAVCKEVERLFRLQSGSSDVAAVIRFDPGPEFVLVGTSRDIDEVPLGSRWEPKDVYASTRVLRTGRSARVDESELDLIGGPDAEFMRSQRYLSQVASPISVEGRLWGAITINARDPLPPNAEERLAKFTALVRTGIANAESRIAVARLVDEQAALRRVAELVAREASPDELFTRVTEEVGRLLGVEAATMHVFPGDGTFTTVAAWQATGRMPPLGPRGRLDPATVTGRVMETGTSARVHRYIDLHDESGRPHRVLHSAVSGPIVVEGRLWGALTAGNRASTPAPDDAETRISAFTKLVASAVSNAEARRDLRRVVDEQAALRRVATLVARGVRPVQIFSTVSNEVGRLFGSDRASVARFEPDGAAIVLVGVSEPFQETLPVGTRFELDENMASGVVSRTRRSARVDVTDIEAVEGAFAHTMRDLGIVSTVASPIVVEGQLWGTVTVSSRDEPLPADAEARLEQFTELVATAIANAEGKSELAASRRRIVTASDETRRRIERDLHDGAQQRLVSLSLELRSAEATIPEHLPELEERIDKLAGEIDGVIDDLREMSQGIHPAILSEGGLAPALRTLARRAALPVELDIEAAARYPEPVEVAAYYVVSEALTNTAKHADASRARVAVAQRDGTIRLTIDDDGVGGADAVRGTGLIGLRDRVEALGGTIVVSSPSGGGTRLDVELPVTEV